MPKAWKDVLASPAYQALAPMQQAQAQTDYFNAVVRPHVGSESDRAWHDFISAYPLPTGQSPASPDGDRQLLEAMTPYERAQVLERHRNGGAQTVGEAMTQLAGAAPAVSPPAGALTSTPEGAAPGSRSFGQAVRDTGHNALVALGEPARGRLSLPGLQVALQGLATLPVPGANPAAGLMAYDRAAAAVLPEDVRPAPEGAGAWERALTETALPSLAAFADPANMGAMVAGGALAAPVAGALGLGEVLASPVASAAGKAAARAMQTGLGGAGALGAFGGVEAAQRGEGLGGTLAGVAHGAATGLELGATAGMPGGVAGRLLGEVGIFGLAAPAIEGRMPTEDDVVGAIVMIGGLNAARGLSPGAIRGLLKRREQRTPEEAKAVDEIPPEQIKAIAQEIKLLPAIAESQRANGPAPILMMEGQQGVEPGTGKPRPPMTTAAQVKTPEEIQAARFGENAPPEVPISPKTEPVPREAPDLEPAAPPVEPTPAPQAPALPVAASESPGTGKVPAHTAEAPQGAAGAPLPKKGDRMEVASRFGDVRVGDKGSVVKAWVVKKGERAGNRYVTLDFGATRDGKRIRNTYPENVLRAAEATPAPAEAPKPKRRVLKAAKPEPPESSQAGFLNLEAFGAVAHPDRAVKRTKVKGARGVSEAVEGGFSPVSSRLRRINPDLERRTRGLMHETGTATIAARDTAKGLQEGLLKMAREDPDAYTALEVALSQGDSARIAQMIERAGLQKQYQAIREYLDATRERMLDAGIEVGEVPGEYFPRRVRDYAGLMDHLGSEAAGEIGKQLKARADKLGVPVDALPPEIRDQIVNSYLRGRIPPGEGKPGMTKPRTIDNFTEDLLPFYYRPEEALAKYISTAEEAIARARFFGKGEDVTGSIGSYVADLIARGEIKPSQEREVKNALLSLFNRNPSWQFIRDTKNVTYAMTMGSTASAVTQVGDLAWSLYENGAYQTVKQAGKSILRKQGLSKQDIGIQDIASEFDSLGKSGKALDTLFKLTGLEQMDALGKETLINGSLARARKQAKRIAAGKKDYAARRFQRDLDRYFGSEQEQILKDLASGETTEPVKFFLFNKLLDYQPVARSEMPQFYLEHPNMRIGYQLKSFTLKQMDAFRRESFDLIRDGARKGDRQMQIDGMRNLVRLGSFFVLANASADVIKDVMFGRGLPKADDLMWDNVLRLFGFSRYLTWRVRREGLGTAAAQFVGGPIVGKLDDAWKDGVRIHRGLTKSEYEVEWDKLRLLNSFPLAGAWYFWYKGQGADWIKEDAVKEAKENAPGVRQSRSSRPTRPTRQGR